MELWVLVSLAAAAAQTIRFLIQKRLRGAGLPVGGATFSRFLFGAPLALTSATGVVLSGDGGVPAMPAAFRGWAATGGANDPDPADARTSGFARPDEVPRVVRAWRTTMLVGLTGMLGSLGWFWAFALENAAHVRAVGQVALLFSLVAGALVLGERITRREVAGIAILGASVVVLVLVT